jgi:UDP-glucose 4-epimerase
MEALLPATTCVIGGAGFIGRAVVEALIANGRRVIVIGRSAPPQKLPPKVRYLQSLPGNHIAVMSEALMASTEIIDLAYATSPGTSFQDPVNDILANLPETVRLFELAATMTHLRKFVWISSGGTVYGRTNIPLITEDHPTLPLSPYGITKLATEKYAHMYFENTGLPVVCVRPSNAFGEGQRPYIGQGFIATAIASVLDGRTVNIFGEHGTVRDYLHVADMAHGIVAALLGGVPGEVYNIGSGVGLTNRQVLDSLVPFAERMNKKVSIGFLPERPFDVPMNVLDSTKLYQLTGWRPQVPFSQALQKSWNWYVHNH